MRYAMIVVSPGLSVQETKPLYLQG